MLTAALGPLLGAVLPGLVFAGLEVDLLSDPDAVRIVGETYDDKMGRRMAACDINGDGIDDLVLGAPDADGPDDTRISGGDVYLVYGHRRSWTGPLSILDEKAVTIFGQRQYDMLGDSVFCGDVNGDGFGDVVTCALGGDGPGDSRSNSGQAHIVLGGPSLPPVIDLLTYDSPVIYGEQGSYSGFCEHPRVGDLNGDGIGDIAVDDGAREDPSGSHVDHGRVYVLFGRDEWPLEIDLRTDADVIVYGREAGDTLGRNVWIGDLDLDGTADLIAAARAEEAVNGCASCGEVYGFRGRAVWPQQIDLAVDTEDLSVYGVDPWDGIGTLGGLAVGDLDHDGFAEIEIGTYVADGRDNTASYAGEARVFEPGPVWPLMAPLETESDSVIYGDAYKDYFAAFVSIGDVNGDKWDDLAVCAYRADGPSDAREDAGDALVWFGRNPFPPDLDAANADLTIYGAEPSDSLCGMLLADLNGDLVDEVIASAKLDALSEVWIVSPFDADADGITQLPDNCPLVSNPDQADADADGVGDACEGDWDGDGQLDEFDCAPADPLGGQPGVVCGLDFEPGSKTALGWDPVEFADSYDISRDMLSRLDGSNYGECQNYRDPDLSDTRFDDDEQPADGSGWFYLVRGQNIVCPASGSYGADSVGSERNNGNPNRCP